MQVKPYEKANSGKKEQVTQMFDTIAGNYDGLNRVISLGIDRAWRKKVIAIVCASKAQKVLDIATGTGDLALALAQKNIPEVVGLDISAGMLEVGKQKIAKAGFENKVTMLVGDSENLPFDNNSFDAITVSFGVRNFENLDKGLQEINRVLKLGGTFVVLETSVPTKFPFKQGYYVYTRLILPLIGKIFSRDKVAYGYLSKSAARFPFGTAFNNILHKNGFIHAEHKPQTFGVATIYVATK